MKKSMHVALVSFLSFSLLSADPAKDDPLVGVSLGSDGITTKVNEKKVNAILADLQSQAEQCGLSGLVLARKAMFLVSSDVGTSRKFHAAMPIPFLGSVALSHEQAPTFCEIDDMVVALAEELIGRGSDPSKPLLIGTSQTFCEFVDDMLNANPDYNGYRRLSRKHCSMISWFWRTYYGSTSCKQ